MSNVSHPRCPIRNLADDAKKRLQSNTYNKFAAHLMPPKDVTPSQKQIYVKLQELYEAGEEIVNPIQQLADQKLLDTLPHDERQRYIFQLSSDYVAMKKELMSRLAASDKHVL